MSHFSVLVASRSVGQVESILAPYQENNGNGCSIEYLKFEDCTGDVEEDYEEYRYTNKYDDIDDFALSYYNYDKVDGKYGYWFNPQAMWDWYQIGGRWGGLKTKEGHEVGSVRKGNVDFSIDEGIYDYSIRAWELIVEDVEPETEEDKRIIGRNYYNKDYFTERFVNKETYAKTQAMFNAYAFIDLDGEWHGQGEMGLFGLSSETANESLVHQLSFLDNFIKDLDDDVMLTLVDCHI
jgi:hypothetical protein